VDGVGLAGRRRSADSCCCWGIVVGLGQALELDLGRVGWPFFVIVPGLALLGVGLARRVRILWHGL
jgi:hypothetical protein